VARQLAPVLRDVKPTLVDRMVSYVDPVRGVRRMQARQKMALTTAILGGAGGYYSGRSDRPSLKEYNPLARDADGDINPGLDKTRARSRDQVRNNPLAAGAINTKVTSVVGSGLACQPRIDRKLLGIEDDRADDWERSALRVWQAWAESTECDLEDELDFYQMQELVFRGICESGDILRIRRFLWDEARARPGRGSMFATKVQLIEADRICNPDYQWDTDRLAQGVEVDADGRPIRYWVRTSHPGTLYLHPLVRWVQVPVRSASGHRQAQLLYRKIRPGQRRGVPDLAPVIEALKQLERYSEAELTAAVVSSFFTVFLRSEAGDDALGSYVAGDEDDEAALTEKERATEVRMGSGLVMDVGDGFEEPSFANPTRPNAQYDPFMTAHLRQIGAALEIPFEILAKHFQSSYSASRGALVEFWKFVRGRRQFLVGGLCQPSYDDVIGEAVARGILDAPGFFESPMLRRAWLGSSWAGDPMPQIDPLKEVAAAKLRIDVGVSTIDRESMELNGSTFEENHGQRVKEERMRREDGLSGEVVAERIITESTSRQAIEEGDEDEDEDGDEKRAAFAWTDRMVERLLTATTTDDS
jgi:lambda family phage portal protein